MPTPKIFNLTPSKNCFARPWPTTTHPLNVLYYCLSAKLNYTILSLMKLATYVVHCYATFLKFQMRMRSRNFTVFFFIFVLYFCFNHEKYSFFNWFFKNRMKTRFSQKWTFQYYFVDLVINDKKSRIVFLKSRQK